MLLVALFVLFAIIGAMSGKSTNSGPNKSRSQQGPENSGNRTTITFDGGRKIQGVVVDGTIYGIYAAKITDGIGGTEFTEATRPSGRFIILQMFVRNETKETRQISLTQAKLIDSNGNSYSTSSEGETALTMSGDKEAEFLLSEIQPGLQKFLKIVYDVPAGKKAFTLRIPHGMFSGGEEGELPLRL